MIRFPNSLYRCPLLVHTHPMSTKSALENSALVEDLTRLSKKAPKLVKSSEAPVPGCEEIVVRSWKMNEFKYYDVPSPFPTLARGLFTTDAAADEGVKHRIVIRGYDKFFNIGEVPWTTWPALKAHTGAPYVLSLKSNGCIIFIAAITPQKLIVTSKHSVGIGGEDVSHAARGRSWLNRYLVDKGRVEADLAAVLWENQWTAIAELCDDSFEEHVLPYSPEKTGLHLHGLNHCTKPFRTLPHTAVDAFAAEWGFIRTPSVTLDTVEDVQAFTARVGETGRWNDEAVEGFVVRTAITRVQSETPYAVGDTFFFKVKFDEPYMMYRDWREVTKTLLSMHGKGVKMTVKSLSKAKLKRKETQEYVAWVIKDIQRNPGLYEQYARGKGIIASRERYLKGTDPNDPVGLECEEEGAKQEFGKTIIVPVAIPGCGKTSVSLALAHLFGWGHTQSDNVQAKKAAPAFIKNVVNLLKDHDVVIADKNNHLKQHRAALREAVEHTTPPVRLLALNWEVFAHPPALVHRICCERIVRRGERHQTLRPSAPGKVKGKKQEGGGHEEVVWMFLNTAEELALDEVDEVVDMPIEDEAEEEKTEGVASVGLEKQVRCAVEGVCGILNLEIPSDERVRQAVAYVKSCEDLVGASGSGSGSVKKQGKKVKQEVGAGGKGGKSKGSAAVRYYGILPEVDLVKLIEPIVASSSSDDPDSLLIFWTHLQQNNRVNKRPHITIVHANELRRAEVSDEARGELQGLWDACQEVYEGTEGKGVMWKGKLTRLVWDGRVMVLVVDDLKVQGTESSAVPEVEEAEIVAIAQQQGVSADTPPSKTAVKAARNVVDRISEGRRRRLHLTVGTRDGTVAALEGRSLVEAWRDLQAGGEGEERNVRNVEVPGGGVRVKGVLRGLMG